MDFRLIPGHRRIASYSALPIVRAGQCSGSAAPRPALDEVLRAFRAECAGSPIYPVPTNLDSGQNGEIRYDWETDRRYMTHAGYRVRSKAEKIIADFLTHSGIRFLYEPVLSVAGARMRPDFFLTDYALPYEPFGLNTESYLRAAELKVRRYYQAGVPFIYTTFHDEPDLEDVIVDRLAEATLGL